MAPKRLISAVLALVLSATLAATLPVQAETPDPAAGKTRRLFVTVGEERLGFEIPEGMCFADQGNYRQAVLIDMIRRALAKKGDETLLGLFMPCDSLANAGNPVAREGRVPSFGVILHPHKLENISTRSSTAGYLDWRAPSFHEYAAVNVPVWMFLADPLRDSGDTASDPEMDGDMTRSDNALVTTFSQYLSADAQPFPTVGALGTTLIKGHPIEIAVRLNPLSGITTNSQAYEFMTNFMELQAAFNR